MIEFTNTPPPDPRGRSLDLVRTPTRRALVAFVTSADIIGCPTHFYGGRTVPCEGADCEPHRKGIPWRWHGYLGCFDNTLNRPFIFEFTARVAEVFVEYREAHGTIRGCIFRAQRVNDAPNAKVILATKTYDPAKITLPKEPDVIQALAIIWNIATPRIELAGVLKDAPRININRDGNGEVFQPTL